jgi:outer membrane protein assembly factor BamB
VLLILREEGDLVAAEASAERYRELGRQKVIDGPAWALPALADGRVYCRSNAGVVVCLELGSR